MSSSVLLVAGVSLSKSFDSASELFNSCLALRSGALPCFSGGSARLTEGDPLESKLFLPNLSSIRASTLESELLSIAVHSERGTPALRNASAVRVSEIKGLLVPDDILNFYDLRIILPDLMAFARSSTVLIGTPASLLYFAFPKSLNSPLALYSVCA